VNITATLLGQMITFSALIWFTMKFIWPPLTTAMDARQQKIADGLAAAEDGHRALDDAAVEIEGLTTAAKTQATEIIAQAEKRGGEIVDAAKEKAREEGKRLLSSAQAELEQEINRARTQLRTEVATIAVAGAERILAHEIDAEKHQQLLGDLANQL